MSNKSSSLRLEQKMRENWADIAEDGHPVIDWEMAVDNAMAFDGGARDYDASLGKLIIAVQRMAFERGFDAGMNAKHPQERLLSMTMGNA
jgi:hypothetical protein